MTYASSLTVSERLDESVLKWVAEVAHTDKKTKRGQTKWQDQQTWQILCATNLKGLLFQYLMLPNPSLASVQGGTPDLQQCTTALQS